jgi:hypothetical protein
MGTWLSFFFLISMDTTKMKYLQTNYWDTWNVFKC